MAELTERLPLTEGTNKVYDIPASPSVIGAVAGFAADTLSGYMQIRRDESERKRREKEAADKAREKEAAYSAIKGYGEAVDLANRSAATTDTERQGSVEQLQGLTSDTAGLTSGSVDAALNAPAGEVFSQASINPSVAAAAQQSGTDIKNVETAVQQGRMPAISLKAALNGKFNQLIDQYPDQAENVLDIWKKMGIDTTLFREGKDLGDQLDETREARQRQTEDERKFTQHAFEIGAEALGETMATGGANGGPMTRDEVISHGLVVMRQGHDMQLELQQINIQTQKTALSKAEADQLSEDRNQVIFKNLNAALYNGSNPVVNMVQNLANSILKEPNPAKQAEQWQAVGTRLHAMIGNSIEQGIQRAYAGGYTGDEGKLRSALTNQFKRVEDLFTGEFSVAQAHIKALQTIQTKLKIDGAQALPVYTALHDLGLDPNTMSGFINGISENSDLAKSLRNEIKGFSADFGKDRASEHLIQIIHMLRGESTLGYMSPSEARNKLPTLYNAVKGLTASFARANVGDPEMVMNGLGELSIATNSLTPSSGANAHIVAIQGVLGTTQVQALRKLPGSGVDPAMATATIQAARAAGAHALNNFQANLGKLNNENRLFKIRWDDRNGKYTIDRAAQPRRLTKTGRQGMEVSVLNPDFNRPIPDDMRKWVLTANVSLDGLIALKDLDPSTPKGTDMELRNYYGRNITPESLRKQDKAINVDSEINKQFEAIEQTIDRNLTAGNRDIPTPKKPTDYKSLPGYAAVAEPIKTAAAKYNVPEAVAVALLGFESHFDPNAEGPVIKNKKSMHYGDRAMGMGQVMAKTAEAYGVSDRSKLTTDQQIDLAIRYVSDLKNRHGGSWQDAVSRYFSGRPYMQAVREGASDSYSDVINYVESILGS